MVSCWIAAHKKLLSFCLVNAAFYSNLKKNWLSPFRIDSLDFSVFGRRGGRVTFSASSGKGRGRPGQMEKWGPKRNCFRISDSVATQKGDGVMNRSSFAVAASFSIAASVAFGSMGYLAAYAVDGGVLMRCQRCKDVDGIGADSDSD